MNQWNIPLELNTIFYGPPGTGKTHAMLELAKEYFTSQDEVSYAEERNDSIASGLTWWEAAALVLKDMGTPKMQSEIMHHPLMQAKVRISPNNTKPFQTVSNVLQSHTKDDCPNVHISQKHDPEIFSKTRDSKWSIDENVLSDERPDLLELYDQYKTTRTPVPLIKHYEFITFHQSFCYEHFVEGITAKTITDDDDDAGQIFYKVEPGIFKTLCEDARRHPDKPYALLIDEINRGNVSGIFGELITLIEEDKRASVHVTLPCSRTTFTVPKNLFIIASMNTADRSIDAVDAALGRRFSRIEMQPKPELLQIDEKKPKYLSIDLKQLLETINRRVEFLLDRDHRIGHSFFMKIRGNSEQEELNNLRTVMKNEIIPLLEDYFYGDLNKVAMVLGTTLIRKTDTLSFSRVCFDTGDRLDLPDKNLWEKADIMKLEAGDFETILRNGQ